MALVSATSTEGLSTIDVVDRHGIVSPQQRPPLPFHGNPRQLAINEDATLVAFSLDGIVDDVYIFKFDGTAWVRAFFFRFHSEQIITMDWKPTTPPDLKIVTNRGRYIMYEWAKGWQKCNDT